MEEKERIALVSERADFSKEEGNSSFNETRIDGLLTSIRRAAAMMEEPLAPLLQQLQESLVSSSNSRDLREKVAETLLTSVSCPTTTSPLFHSIQECLVACGRGVAISTAIRTLRNLGATSNPSLRMEDNKRSLSSDAAVNSENDPILTLDLCLTVLRRLILTSTDTHNNDLDDDAFDESSNSESSSALLLESWVQMLLLIPSTVANACHALRVPMPVWATPSKYHARLVRISAQKYFCHSRAAAATAWTNERTSTDDHDGMMKQQRHHGKICFPLLVQHVLRRPGGDEHVALALQRVYNDNKEENVAAVEAMTLSLWQSLVPRESARLCRAMLQLVLSSSGNTLNLPERSSMTSSSHNAPRWRQAWLEHTIRHVWKRMNRMDQKDHTDAFVRLAIFSSSSIVTERHMDWQFCYAVASLMAGMEENDGSTTVDGSPKDDDDDSTDDDELLKEEILVLDRFLYRYVMQAAQSWSQGALVRQTEASMQRHVSCFLQAGLSLLDKLSAESRLVELLLEGIDMRLASTNVDIRKDGMYVAVLLAWGLGEKVEFEELQQEHESTANSALIETSETVAECVAEKAQESPKQTQKRKKRFFVTKQIDPDAEFVSDDESDSEAVEDNDSVWDDDSALEAYDLYDDEEDLRQTPKPRYLADCVDLLRTPETEEFAASHHETALQEISGLVRSRPLDLSDFGPDLARELLRFENKFNIDRFQDLVSASLCSLAVEEPVAVGKTLIEEMFQDSGLVDRLRVLETLSDAALELSGGKDIQDRAKLHTITIQSSQGTDRIQADPEARASAQSLVAKATQMREVQTRRWGRARTTGAEERSVENRFGAIGPNWFYLLLGHFIERRDSAKLWSGTNGATLLSRLFFTLAAIVECCGNTPGTDALANDLIQLVWSFRGADVAEVRASVLFGVASSFTLLRDEAALALILDDSPDGIGRDLSLIAANDPDENCRRMAALVSRGISSVVESIGGSEGSLLL